VDPAYRNDPARQSAVDGPAKVAPGDWQPGDRVPPSERPTVGDSTDAKPAKVDRGADGGLVCQEVYSEPGTGTAHRYGVLAGRGKPNDDAPEASIVLWLPEGTVIGHVFDDDESVTAYKGS